MREIFMSGSMSGERKRSVAAWPKQPRLSSTLHELALVLGGIFGNRQPKEFVTFLTVTGHCVVGLLGSSGTTVGRFMIAMRSISM
jgi:hypothetical protein